MKKIKFSVFWNYLSRHKYLITICICGVYVGVIDENSFRSLAIHQLHISELETKISEYQQQFERDSLHLRTLLNDPKGVERIARERYLMKRPNEDIFIMSSDQNQE